MNLAPFQPAPPPPGISSSDGDPWQLRLLAQEELDALGPGSPRPSREQLAYFCRFGLLAPTTHNTVPQRFRIAPEGALEIWLDRGAVLPASDAQGRQASVSAGCAIGQIALAARCYGYSTRLEVEAVPAEQLRPSTEKERPVRLARLELSRGDEAKADRGWLSAMLDRRTTRAEYDRSPMDPALAAKMKALAPQRPGVGLHLLADAPTLFVLGKFQEAADVTVLNREAFARELGAWFLPNDASSPVGMRGREFGLGDEAARRIHRGLLGLEPLLPDEVAGMAKGSGLGMRSASAVAVITCERDDTAHRIAAGQTFCELALLLCREGLATAMHAGIVEVESANLALRSRLRTARRPTVVFRMGRPLRPEDGIRPHAARPRLEAVLLR
jgi:hypothetical protein